MSFQSVLLSEAIKTELSPSEIVSFYLADHLFDKSFRLLKQNKLSQANHYMNEGEKLLGTFDIHSKLYSWGLTVYLPKKSYSVFRGHDEEAAMELVEQNIAVLRKLIDKGFDFLIFHLIQQTQNQSRLLFSKDRKTDALHIIKHSLRFLYETNTNLSCLSGLSLDRFKANYPNEALPVIYSFINQLTNESLVAILKNETDESIRNLLLFVFSDFNISSSLVFPESGEVGLTKAIHGLFRCFADHGDCNRFIPGAIDLIDNAHGLTFSQSNLLTTYILFFTGRCGMNTDRLKSGNMKSALPDNLLLVERFSGLV